jgi:RecA/RadA recombinase
MSDFFRNLADEIKDIDSSILADGENAAEFTGYIDTGCYMLNAVLSGSIYGGVPNNKVTAFAGEPATGKTFFVLSAVRQFLDANPQSGVVYYDTEAAVTKQMMEDRGIDVKRVILAEPETIESFRTHSLKFLDKYMAAVGKDEDRPPMMMVLDSLGMMSTNKEMQDSHEGKDVRDMTKAQVIKGTFRTLTLKLARAKVPLLITNHIYQVVGSYVPTQDMGGGSGLKYAASTIAFLSKKKVKEGTDIVGNIIKVKMNKSRLSKENAQVELLLDYKNGLSKWHGMLEFAESKGIVEKSGARYKFPEEVASVFAKNVYQKPEEYFTESIMEKIEEAVQQEFKYGQ